MTKITPVVLTPGKTFETPYGTFLYQGEALSSTMLRIYNKMVAKDVTDIYKAGECVGLTKDEVDEIMTKDDIKGQVQNIKNSRKFEDAEKSSADILALRDKMIDENGKPDPVIISNVRQHSEFLLERLGKNAGYSTKTENINVNIELSPERREQLAKIIDIS